MKPLTVFTAVLVVALAVPAWAQDYEDEPGQGVARLSLVNGEVTVRRGDTGELIAGERNAPLVARDHVITDNGARAEVQLDWANMIRLAGSTEVRMAELEDGNFLLQVDEGTVTFSVLRDSDTLVEISTPLISVRPTQKGNYRITVRPDGSTEVTVRSGEAEIFTSSRTEVLRPGRTLVARGDPNDPDSIVHVAIGRDDWDRWNEDRDRDLTRSDSYKYVSRDIYGADDLAGHGRWVYDSPYGWVWVPHVAVGWAPYRVGRWAWVNYYGWTWVSSDPWGWAPYHYGRWYNAPRYGWVWYPGPVAYRHYWRPALVGFFGWGSGVSVNLTFGFGNVGWVPLGPYEVYRPWYGRRPATVVNNITVVRNVNIVNTYVNAKSIKGYSGVTSVSSRDFGKKHVAVNNFLHATDRDLGKAGQIRGHVPLEASRESHRYSDRQVNTRNIPNRGPDRQFVRRDSPAGGRGEGRPGQNNGSQSAARAREEAPANPPSALRREPTGGSRAGAGPSAPASRRIESPTERADQPRAQRGGSAQADAAPNATNGRGNSGNRGNDDNRGNAQVRNADRGSEVNSRMSAGQAARRTEVPAPRVDSPSRTETPSRISRENPVSAQRGGNNAPQAETSANAPNGRGNGGDRNDSNRGNGQIQNTERRSDVNSRMSAGQAARRTEVPARVEPPSRNENPSRVENRAPNPEPRTESPVRRGPEVRSGGQSPIQPANNGRIEARPAPRTDNPPAARRAPEESPIPRATPAPPAGNDRQSSVFRPNGGNRGNGGGNGGGNPGGGGGGGPAVRSAPQERSAPAPSPAPAPPPAAERSSEQRQPSAIRGNGGSQRGSSDDNGSSGQASSENSQGRGRGRR
jgi:hypothetical protein